MPEDLRAGPGVTLVTMFGNSSRFNGVDPRCTLVGDANPAAGQFRIQQNCMQQGGQSIVQQMNSLIAKGVVITTGLEEGVGRCSISRAITIDTSTGIATVSVDDRQHGSFSGTLLGALRCFGDVPILPQPLNYYPEAHITASCRK